MLPKLRKVATGWGIGGVKRFNQLVQPLPTIEDLVLMEMVVNLKALNEFILFKWK